MGKSKIILGLTFGDEGKGHVTASITEKANKSNLLIRFSGGPQIGHNVFNGQEEHIFKVFGAGTLSRNSGPTYLSKYVLFFPTVALSEIQKMSELGFNTPLYIDNLCPLITPIDITYQQFWLEPCTDKEFISTGMGINPTMKRHKKDFKIYAQDIKYPNVLRKKLNSLKYYYADILSIKNNHADVQFLHKYNFNDMIEDFIKDCQKLLVSGVNFVNEQEFLSRNRFKDYIFEGSQGILLDQNHGFFPFVTHANTTSQNALQLITDNNLSYTDEISINYIMRSYLTRHGDGYMGTENKDLNKNDLVNTDHEINIYGPYQGNLHLKTHDLELLNFALDADDCYSYAVNNKSIFVTCLDQTENKILINKNEYTKEIFTEFFPKYDFHFSNSPNFKKLV